MSLRSILSRVSPGLGLACLLLWASPSQAVPSYARQTGQECAACHIGSFGPQLTPYGIKFKIGGYTDSDGKDGHVPVSGMAVASFTNTNKKLADPPDHGYKRNNNVSVDEISLFLAGKLAENIGSFVQVTYDGTSGDSSIDQMDLRFAHATTLAGKDLVVGLSLNNNPGVQDPFNTLSVWGFPYVTTPFGFSGAETGSFANGAVEQRVLGLTAYAFYDNSWYAEAGTYRSLRKGLQDKLGLDVAEDPGHLKSGSAYWRLAYFKDLKIQAYSAGVFGFSGSLQPDHQVNRANGYNDIGIDAMYQYLGTREHIVTVQGSYLREHQKRSALLGSGDASNKFGHLNELKLNTSYTYLQTWGASLGYFNTSGDSDSTLYADNTHTRPNTAGGIVELNWTPFGKEASWGAPWANARFGAQYTFYGQYNGSSKNYDGTGRSASDNNTLFLYVWTAF